MVSTDAHIGRSLRQRHTSSPEALNAVTDPAMSSTSTVTAAPQ